MLNRRFLRVKVLQQIYAYHQAEETDLLAAERRLLNSVDSLYELFIRQLTFWVEVKCFAERRIEENMHKNFPTEEDLNPNRKFVNNRVINALENNRDLQALQEKYKINWDNDREDFIRGFYNRLREYPEYQEYMISNKDSFAFDKKLILDIIDHHMAENKFLCPDCGFVCVDDESPERCPQCGQTVEWKIVDETAGVLLDFYSDKNLLFNSDFQLGLFILWKFFNEMEENFGPDTKIPTAFKTENDETNDDKNFIIRLFRLTMRSANEYRELVKSNISNWDYDRIALMDKIIIFMALTEFSQFHDIPVKVTINEYIEISKYYSTPDSRRFVNGILDKLAEQLKAEGKLIKSGRGLV